jgi:hypothetical protein
MKRYRIILMKYFFNWIKRPGTSYNFFMFFIAVTSLMWGVYSQFHVKNPRLLFDIYSRSNVLDVHRTVRDLSVYFQGEDIQKKKLNLQIVTIKVENTGDADIKLGDYDANQQWGFKVDNGQIIEVRLIDANDASIKLDLDPHVINSDIVKLNKVIFERGKYFVLEVLLLHQKDRVPSIIPIGKIVGIDNILPLETWTGKVHEPLSIAEILMRFLSAILILFIYIIIVVLIIVAYVMLSDKIDSFKKKRRKERRESIASSFPSLQNLSSDSPIKQFFSVYVLNDIKPLKELDAFIKGKQALSSHIKEYETQKQIRMKIAEIRGTKYEPEVERSLSDSIRSSPYKLAGVLLEKGYLAKASDNNYEVKIDFERDLERVIKHIESKK